MRTKVFRAVGVLTAAAFLTVAWGCASTVNRRIRADQDAFDAYPPEVQEQIRAGTVGPGFTEEMVRMALGDPARVRTRVTGEQTEEVWIYATRRPGFSVGMGVGTGGGRAGVGTGAGVHTGGRREESARVIFRDGVVHSVETDRGD